MISMGRLGTLSGLLTAACLCGNLPLLAATVTTPVSGTMSPTQETCFQGLANAVGDGENCMYDGGPAAGGNDPIGTEVTGPNNQVSYYDADATPAAFEITPDGLAERLYVTTVGDGKIAQKINGTITIDDGGDGFGAGDLISFSLTLTSPGGGAIIRHYSTSVVDKYNSMTQTLAPFAAHSATANGAGGFDYIIGTEGFPTPLTFAVPGACFGKPFGEAECGHSFSVGPDPDFWDGTSLAGLGLLEGNRGAKTVGTVTGLDCRDSKSATGVDSNDCFDSGVSYSPWVTGPCATPGGCTLKEGQPSAVRGAAEDVGWDDMLLKVSTDALGKVIAVEGFNVDDYKVFGQVRCGDNTAGTGSYVAICNSWTSGRFTLAAASGRTATDDGPVIASEGVPVDIAVMANDLNFSNPVTVSIATQPTQGTVTVQNSPGSPAGIRIRYTANIGATGTDTFVYAADDGTGSDSATVSVLIGVGANDDTAETRKNTPVALNVAANDTGFDNTVAVTVDAGSFSQGGSASVTAGNGGSPASVVVTYTPAAPANTPTYTETFSYTIDDGVLPAFTGTVAVTVRNSVPVAADAAIAISTLGVAPPDGLPNSGTYTVDLAGPVGDAPATVTIAVQGTRGTAIPVGNVITYTISDTGFLVGTDTITYTITDADGDSDSGVLTIFADDGLPVLVPNFIVTARGKSSVPLNLRIDKEGGLLEIKLGNGNLEEHTLEVSRQGIHGTCALRPEDGVDEVWFTLVYTPTDPDFVGADNTCQLRLTDGDGDVATTSVSVKVVEPAPVGGASALDPWSLLFLAGAPVLRRIRRRRCGSVSHRISALTAFTLMAASVSAWGQAQGPSPPKATDDRSGVALTEIVVTSRRIAEKLLEVPLAITAFNADAIESKGITNLADVAALTPGLSFFNAFGENLPVPVIRGIAPTDIFGANNAAIFVDGVYISGRAGLNAVQFDQERIEVLKGPQSAIYGRNAFSGAVNYVTALPGEEFEAKISGELGNYGKIRATAMINVPIFGDKLLSRFAGLYDDWDGSYTNSLAPENDLGGYRYRGFKAALRSRPVEDLELNLSYYNSNDGIDEAPNVSLPTNCEDRVNDNNAAERLQNFCGEVPDIESIPGLNGGSAIPKVAQATGEKRDLDRAFFRVEWDLHDYGTISALTGYSKTRQSSVSDFLHSLGQNGVFLYCTDAVNTPGIPNTCNTGPTETLEFFRAGVYDLEPGGETEDWSQELRYASDQGQRFRYLVGGYWFKVTDQSLPGGIFATQPLPLDGNIALPPFSDPPDSPNLAIGSAIFYETFTPDGGIDPLLRKTREDNTRGSALFGSVEFSFTESLTGRAELRTSRERQQIELLRYNRCLTSATTNGILGNCAYPEQLIGLTGDDKFDLRLTDPVPQFGPDCQFTSLEGLVKPGTAGQCGRRGSSSFDSVTGRVGLDFKITAEWMVYGSVAYAEKPGGLQLTSGRERSEAGAEFLPVTITNRFLPEELTAYELGLKGTAWDRRISIESAVFYSDWKKIVLRQLSETNPETGRQLEQPVALSVNAGDAGVLGLEIEANVAFTDGLSSRLTLGWVDAELDNAAQDTYESFPAFAADGYATIGGDVSGNKLLRQPEWLLSGSLDYKHPLPWGSWEWYAGVNANYQSGVYVGNDNQGYLPEHTYVNPRLGVKSDVYTIEFWARNLFNDTGAIAAFRDIYWSNSTDQYSAVPVGATIPGARPGFDDFVPLRYTVTYPNERTFGVTARMSFGAAVK